MKNIVQLEYPELATLMEVLEEQIIATEKRLTRLKSIQDACERFQSAAAVEQYYLEILREKMNNEGV